MAQNERARLRQQAQVIRQEGQPVFLRIANETSKPAVSLLDGITAQRAPALSTDKRVLCYAVVRYHKQSELKFDEAGRMTYREATIELISMYETDQLHQISNAYAVELQDGSIMEITSRNLSEGQDTYVLETCGYVNIGQ